MPEIEKKFRLPALPPTEILGPGRPIVQAYLFVDGAEMRIRRKGDHCYLTVKGRGSLIRDEWETEILDWVFKLLWPKTEGRRLEKTRYEVSSQGFDLEIDIYSGRLQGLITLECELPDKASSSRFFLPSWAAEAADITGDKAYKNKNLATHGLPALRSTAPASHRY